MSTIRQITANRRNAQKSTGPVTPEGRAAVRLNSVTHGLTAQTIVLPGEDPAEFQSLLDAYEAEFAPATRSEADLIEQMAMATWRLRRLRKIEASYYAYKLDDDADRRDEYHSDLDDFGKLAYLVRDASAARVLANLSRHEMRLERSYHVALRDLLRLRAERRTGPSKPQPQPQAEKIGSALPNQNHSNPSCQITNMDLALAPTVPPKPVPNTQLPIPKIEIHEKLNPDK